MFQKSGKFYADWRDESGARHRKAFTTARDASLYERQHRRAPVKNTRPVETHITTKPKAAPRPKLQGGQAPSRPSSSPLLKGATIRTVRKSRGRSLKSQATKPRPR
jgi:hypothetical protein